MKKILIILTIILILLIGIVIYIIVYKGNSTNWIDENVAIEGQMYRNGIENSGFLINGITPNKVNNNNIFFTVEGCIKDYIKYSMQNDKNALVSLLDYKIKENNAITEENVKQFFIPDNKTNINKTIEMYGLSRKQVRYLLC